MGHKWKCDDPRYKNKARLCDVDGCTNPHYAKGLCHKHYQLQRKTGRLIYKRDMPKLKCSVDGCEKLVSGWKGFCKFHKIRLQHGIDLDRPKGVKGELNIHWKGGVAYYPNHYEMKKIRKVVLEEANYICYYCGKPTKRIHHKDRTRHNHSKSNLVACCASCGHKRGTSKYKRIYGKTLEEMSQCVNVSMPILGTYHRLHGNLYCFGFHRRT
jgi:5-methylcytosine-specific restriction endonuclease McrA